MCQFAFRLALPLVLLLLLGLGGCVFDHGFRVSIHPLNSISPECFERALEAHIPDLKFEDERRSGSQLYFNFRMTDQFRDKISTLEIRGLEKHSGKLDSKFRYRGEKLDEILFAFLYDEKLNQMSQEDMRRVAAFARPYADAIKGIPETLQRECGLEFDKKQVEIRCQGILCE